MKSWTIRKKILFLATAPVIVTATLLTWSFLDTHIANLESTLRERGDAIARHFAQACEYPVFSGNKEVLDQLAKAAQAEPDVTAVNVYDSTGEPLVQNGDTTKQKRSDKPDDSLVFRAPVTLGNIEIEDIDSSARLGTIIPRTRNKQLLGWVSVELSRRSTLMAEHDLFLSTLLIAGGGVFISIVIALRIGRSISSPIHTLSEAASRIEAGDLSVRVEQQNKGELGVLEHSIQSMVSSLKSAQKSMQKKIDEATTELRRTLDTVEKQNEELERARQLALDGSKAKSDFLANISHEIRTPMNAIVGFSDCLRKTPLNQEQADYTETIRQSAGQLINIVNDVLDLSRIETGKVLIQEKPFTVRQVIEEVATMLAPLAYEKKNEVATLVYRDIPQWLIGDPVRIRQILINLAHNALKFTDGGEVTIRAILEDEVKDGIVLRISVSDTGPGITRENCDKLFSKFTQFDSASRDYIAATGLGLAITKTIVEQMNGTIGVDSVPGQGSTFWFNLPFRKAAGEAGIGPEKAAFPGKRALVCDQHHYTRLAMRHLLEDHGFAVWEAEDMDSAFQLIRKDKNCRFTADLLVLGLTHEQSDDHLAKELHSMRNGHDNPWLIVLLNTARTSVVQAYEQIGNTVALSKPARRADLGKALERLAGRVREEQPSRSGQPASIACIDAARHSACVLIADDHPVNRKLIVTLLQYQNLSVDSVADGAAAVAAAARNRYDLIILDIHMPVMDGLSAARMIRKNEGKQSHTPIVSLSADAVRVNEQQAEYGIFDAFLYKPVREQDLVRVLDQFKLSTDVATPHGKSGTAQDSGLVAMASATDKSIPNNNRKRLEHDLYELLVRDLPGQRRNLQCAFNDSDLDRLNKEAHRLHGAAGICGAEKLRLAAADLEQIAGIPGSQAQLQTFFERVLRQIDRLLDSDADLTGDAKQRQAKHSLDK